MSVFRGASVGVTLTANKSKYSRELKSARAEMKDWERTVERSLGTSKRRIGQFGKAAAVGLGLLGVAAASAGVKMVDMAGDAGEVDSKLEVTFGRNRLAKIAKQIDAFSAATGASRFQLRQQAADMGALLKPMGLTASEMDKMTLATVKLATDLSSFNNVPVDDALLALRSGLTGETEPLKKFGILINAAAIEQEALRSGLAKTKKEITEADKVQARYALILKQTKIAQGDAARTSDSYANTMRRIQNTVTDAGTEIGQRMLPSVTRLANGLASFVQSDQFEGYVDSVGAAAERAADGVASFVNSRAGRDAIRDAAGAVKTLGSGLASTTRFLAEHRTAVTNLAIGYGAFRVATAVLMPLNAAWQLGQVRAAQFAAANAGATRSAVASRVALGAMGGPIGLVAAGLAVGAVEFVNYKRKMAGVLSQSQQTDAAIRSLGSAIRGLSGSALALDEANLNKKVSLAALDDAKRRLGEAKKGTREYRDALLAVEQAELGVKRANQEANAARRSYNKAAGQSATQIDAARVAAAREAAKLEELKTSLAGVQLRRARSATASRNLKDEEDRLTAAIARQSKRVGDADQKIGAATVTLGKNATKTTSAASAWDSLRASIEKTDSVVSSSSTLKLGGWAADAAGKRAGDLEKSIGAGWPLGLGGRGVSGVDSFNKDAARFGMTMTSAYRPGDDGYHGVNRARDYSNGTGPTPGMLAFARYMASTYGSKLRELIYTPLGFSIKNGQRVAPYAQAGHMNHVHVAYAKGGRVGTASRGAELFGLRGEDGPEQIVPLSAKYRSHGLRNLREAASALGVPMFATGGALGAARERAAVAASPAASLTAAREAFRTAQMEAANIRAQLAVLKRGGVSQKEKARVASLTEKLRGVQGEFASLADDVVSREQGVVDARLAAIEVENEAARARSDAAREQLELARQAAIEQRERELNAPRSMMTLTDAMRDLDRAVAESTVTLEDDVAVARAALVDEQARQAAIRGVLGRGDLSNDERADLLGQLAASIRQTTQLTGSVTDLTKQMSEQSGGATLDDLRGLLAAIRDGMRAERGNVSRPITFNNTFAQAPQASSFLESVQFQLAGAGIEGSV